MKIEASTLIHTYVVSKDMYMIALASKAWTKQAWWNVVKSSGDKPQAWQAYVVGIICPLNEICLVCLSREFGDKSPPSPYVPSGLKYEKQFHPMLRYCCMPSCNSMMSKTRKALILKFLQYMRCENSIFSCHIEQLNYKKFPIWGTFADCFHFLWQKSGFNPAKNSVSSFCYIARILRPRSLIAFDMFDILQEF